MFKLLIAASGSKQNSAIVINDTDAIVIDCGTPFKLLQNTLLSVGLCEKNICAVFVTHSHSDHIKGLKTLKNKISAPFYSAVKIEGCTQITAPVCVKNMTVSFFECCHDVECVGYKISNGEKAVAIATDTGIVTDSMISEFTGCSTIMLECNHDVKMLRTGPYPPALKLRIASNEGHLCNDECAKVITYLASLGTKNAVLAHISETNNTQLLARSTVREQLLKYGLENSINVCCANTLTQIEI